MKTYSKTRITKSELFKQAHAWCKQATAYWIGSKVDGIDSYAKLLSKSLKSLYSVYATF